MLAARADLEKGDGGAEAFQRGTAEVGEGEVLAGAGLADDVGDENLVGLGAAAEGAAKG